MEKIIITTSLGMESLIKRQLEEENYKNFYHDLIALIARYENIELRHVGFIENWKELLKP